MPNVKISQLPEVNSVLGTDVVPVVASSATSKITVANLAATIPQVSSSISASYALTASYVLNAVTSSDFPYTGSARITGSFNLIGPSVFTDNTEVHYRDRFLFNSSYITQQISTAQHSLATFNNEAIITTSSINTEFDRSTIISINQVLLGSGSYTFRGDMDYPYAGILNRVNVGSYNDSGDITVNYVNRGFGGSVEGLNGNYVRIDFWPVDSGIVKKTITGNVTAYNAIYDIQAATGSSVDIFNYYVAGNYRNWTGRVPFNNLYGFRVVPMDPRGVNRWAVYQEGSNDRNYFAGSISIGTTQTGSFTVNVSGSGRFTNGLQVTSSLIAPSITGSLFGTSSWTQNSVTSSYPLFVSGTTILSALANYSQSVSTVGSVILGVDAGRNTSLSNRIVAIGEIAADSAENCPGTVGIGLVAAYQAKQSNNSVFIGSSAGSGAVSSSFSIAIGNLAGRNNLSARFSTFLGNGAGTEALYASRSVFLGSETGTGATNAHVSSFIGWRAGYGAVSASYSVLLGYNVGSVMTSPHTIGPNNVIIGSNISLNANRRDSINIGGVLFGTGSYSGIDATIPFSGSANGRIGINQPLPQVEFDVSGSIQGSNHLILTRVSQSLNFADDTAAAAGGVPLGGIYRNGNAIQIRLV